ncbi:MAG: energy-coupling factor ABC transporter substrate-binding protein [Eubacteriales bacterium]|nr:energy-coupling factor ABC transporter substrate-binding protein [Eubacteriales bacterium]
MSAKNKKLVIILLIITALLIVVPFFALRGAEFGGSDDAGSEMVTEITGEEYEPWFEPILETAIGGELPGEIESLLFCVQTGIGVGVIAFLIGKFSERTRLEKLHPEIKED